VVLEQKLMSRFRHWFRRRDSVYKIVSVLCFIDQMFFAYFLHICTLSSTSSYTCALWTWS